MKQDIARLKNNNKGSNMSYSERYLKGHINCSRSVESLFIEADKEMLELKNRLSQYEQPIQNVELPGNLRRQAQ